MNKSNETNACDVITLVTIYLRLWEVWMVSPNSNILVFKGPVEYLKDDSLPASWLVRTIRGRNETLYQSSSSFHKTPADNSTAEEFRFKDKVSVAQFLEGMGHPALEIEQLLFNYPNIARVAPKDGQEEEKRDRDNDSPAVGEDNAIRLDDLVAKTVTPCYVDMVKLPDIFLKHPCVRVKESNNEMLIRDADTGMFIAKKIIYEWFSRAELLLFSRSVIFFFPLMLFFLMFFDLECFFPFYPFLVLEIYNYKCKLHTYRGVSEKGNCLPPPPHTHFLTE